jgi:hypothetical protein
MAASLQRLVISLLVILTFTFIYFAQVSEAAGKGPRITHKVRLKLLSCYLCRFTTECEAKASLNTKLKIHTGLLRHHSWR